MTDTVVKDGCMRQPIRLEIEKPVDRAATERQSRDWYGLRTSGRVHPINKLGWAALCVHIGRTTRGEQ